MCMFFLDPVWGLTVHLPAGVNILNQEFVTIPLKYHCTLWVPVSDATIERLSPSDNTSSWVQVQHFGVGWVPTCPCVFNWEGPILHPGIVNLWIWPSLPGAHLVQEFLITQGVRPLIKCFIMFCVRDYRHNPGIPGDCSALAVPVNL